MPPRVVKRGGSAAKRGGRTPKKGQNQQVEEAAKVEEMEAKEEPKAVIEGKPILQEEKEKEERTVQERRPIVMVDINEPGVNHEGNDTIQLRSKCSLVSICFRSKFIVLFFFLLPRMLR